MPTTRPGFIWSGTEWVAIGQEAVVAPVSYQATAPSSPATGDIWIDSDDEVPGITSSLNYRWRKIATGGETSLSGNDASGLPLAYNPGYEQVYLNGVLQYRGSDYTATTGNTITGLTALVANDTIEVLSFVTAPIGDTYGQAAADAKFVDVTGDTMTGVLRNTATPAFKYVGFNLTSAGMQSGTAVLNQGNGLSIGSGGTYSKFTAPVSGIYLIGFSSLVQENTGRCEIDVRKNGSGTIDGFGSSAGNIGTASAYATVQNTFIFQLNAGDYIDLSLILGTLYTSAVRADRQFYGYLVA